MVGMVVAYNYQPRHNGVNIPLNLYFNYDQDEGHGGTVAELLSLFLTEPFLQKLYLFFLEIFTLKPITIR